MGSCFIDILMKGFEHRNGSQRLNLIMKSDTLEALAASWHLEPRNYSQGIDLVRKTNALEALAGIWHLEPRNASHSIDLIIKTNGLEALVLLSALSSKMVPRASIW